MKEIKFRGIAKCTGSWIYGDLIHNGFDGISRIITIGIASAGCYPVEVIPETVGQFTGLHDKNGKEIYDGDVIATSQLIENHPDDYDTWKQKDFGYTVIEWDNEYMCFQGTKWTPSQDDDVYHIKFCEIIGNIYENPDLIKEG